MKYFEYARPKTVEEASELLLSLPETSKAYAGGTDVMGMLKDRLIAPNKLVNLKSIAGLNTVQYTPGKGLRIGALATIAELADNAVIGEKYPILQQAAREVASPQLRNVGTIGGNLCQSPRCWYFRGEFPCLRKGGDMCYAVAGHNKYHCIVGGGPCYIVHPSDMAVALLALDARVVIQSKKKSRTIPLSEFYVLPEQDVTHENILRSGDVLVEIQVPDVFAGMRSGFLKMKERGAWDFALVSVAAVINQNGVALKSGRIAFGGVAPTPWQDVAVNQKLSGLQISEGSFAQLMDDSFGDAQTLTMNAYKVPLVRNLMKRLLTELTKSQ
jgi:xanthine dehydrogenase YagS FAD-binding subunit